ncbi:hypothetical protein [Deinococcus deserti]|nr:hypothetical protein [Deinococcus deserti]
MISRFADFTTIRSGLALLSEAKEVEELVTLADQRMYQAMAAGRDRLG